MTTFIIYCRMAWSINKLNTRKYNNISLILILLYIFFRQHPVVHYIVSFELKSSVIILLYNWEFFRMKQRLENPSFKSTKDHILSALDNFVDILKIRYSSPLFRLTTASDIEVHEFFASTSYF